MFVKRPSAVLVLGQHCARRCIADSYTCGWSHCPCRELEAILRYAHSCVQRTAGSESRALVRAIHFSSWTNMAWRYRCGVEGLARLCPVPVAAVSLIVSSWIVSGVTQLPITRASVMIRKSPTSPAQVLHVLCSRLGAVSPHDMLTVHLWLDLIWARCPDVEVVEPLCICAWSLTRKEKRVVGGDRQVLVLRFAVRWSFHSQRRPLDQSREEAVNLAPVVMPIMASAEWFDDAVQHDGAFSRAAE